MSPEKWIARTNAIGMSSRRGRYGSGTFAHSDIAMSFATWISPEFQLYLMKDYRRLKEDENSRLSLNLLLREMVLSQIKALMSVRPDLPELLDDGE